jgi:hypothetical protein
VFAGESARGWAGLSGWIPDGWGWTDAPPTWLAFVFAAGATLVAVASWRHERKASRRARERERQEQASLVAVWPNKADLSQPSFGLINGSGAPVWSVVVYAYRWRGEAKERPKIASFDVGVTPPYGTPRYFRTGLKAVDYDKDGYLFAVSFRDSSNVHWYRTEVGELIEGDFPDAAGFSELDWPEPPGHGSPHEIARLPVVQKSSWFKWSGQG